MPAAVTTHTLADAAAILGKKTDTLKKWFAQGCPHTKDSKGYRVSIAEVFEWRILREKSLAQGGDGSGVLSVEASRARLLDAQLEQQEMENKKRRGELVDAAEVRDKFSAMVLACRAKLLSLPDKVAARLGVPNPQRAAKEIREEVNLALKELAEG